MNDLNDLKIESATISDVKEIFALEKTCFEGEAFSKRQFYYLIAKAKSEFVIIRKNKKIIAYLIILKRKNSKQLRIYSLAIAPEARRLGIAKTLLDHADNLSKKEQIEAIFLEVSENNSAAINLYKKHGYLPTGKRPSYYSDGSDALLMGKRF